MAGNRVAQPGSLRTRRRLADMRHVQAVAVDLFDTHGFDAVSVERVAEAGGVSPVSVYRWFGTKEGLVLWDDYDPPLLAAIQRRLADGTAPLQAVRDGVVDELGVVYDRDRALVLARTRLLHREPGLLAATMPGLLELEAALADLFAAADVGPDDARRRTWAAVAVAALRSAVDTWQRRDGREDLADLVTDAFAGVRAVL